MLTLAHVYACLYILDISRLTRDINQSYICFVGRVYFKLHVCLYYFTCMLVSVTSMTDSQMNVLIVISKYPLVPQTELSLFGSAREALIRNKLCYCQQK